MKHICVSSTPNKPWFFWQWRAAILNKSTRNTIAALHYLLPPHLLTAPCALKHYSGGLMQQIPPHTLPTPSTLHGHGCSLLEEMPDVDSGAPEAILR